VNRDRDLLPGLEDGAIIDAMSEASRRTATEDAGPGPTPAAWHRLQVRRARGTRPPWRGLLVAGAGVAAVVALVLVARGVQRGMPVTYAVAEGAAEQDGYIRGGRDGSRIEFSDGTRVDLAQGARVSVLSRGPRGARLRLEEGEARFDVVHRPHAAWSVEAGPYVVYVTGTAFDVRWSGTNEVIEVRMRAGSVQVGGPLLPERVTLRAGQHLTAKLASGELHIGDARAAAADDDDGAPARIAPPADQPSGLGAAPAPALPPQPAAEPALAPERPLAPSSLPAPQARPRREPPAPPGIGPAAPAAAATPSRSSTAHRATARAVPTIGFTPRTWSSAITSGNATRVVAEAEAHGLEKTLLEVDSPALVALADASRYSSRPEVAVRAFIAERQRFPNTPAAHSAAFFLGRLADDRGDVAAGLAWYKRYLSETPQGPYAAEALGRKMLAVERISGRDAARSVAAEYIERFPNGTYLLQAHSILANPTP
jgi:TolA-binding protein